MSDEIRAASSRREEDVRPQEGETLRRIAGMSPAEWVTLAAQFLALGGVLSYGILRLSYDRFYGVFGLTPEELGIGSATIISQSAFGILALLLGITVAPLLSLALMAVPLAVARAWKHRREDAAPEYLSGETTLRQKVVYGATAFAVLMLVGTFAESEYALLRGISSGLSFALFSLAAVWVVAKFRFRATPVDGDIPGHRAERRWWFRLMAFGLAVIAAVIAGYQTLVLRPLIPGDVPAGARDVYGVVLACVAIFFLWQWTAVNAKGAGFRAEQERLTDRWDERLLGYLTPMLLLLLVLASALLFSELPDLAGRRAHCAAEGRGAVPSITTPGRPLTYGRFTLLGVRAQPVGLQWTLPSGSDTLPRRMLLIGQSGEVFFLWDPRARRTHRVSTADGIVSAQPLRSGLKDC